jgi:hypothetical protein
MGLLRSENMLLREFMKFSDQVDLLLLLFAELLMNKC